MTRENVTPIEEVDKVTNILNDIEEPVVPIRRKGLDNFGGHSKGSTGWFNIDHERLKIKFYTIEQDYYKNFLKWILKVKI